MFIVTNFQIMQTPLAFYIHSCYYDFIPAFVQLCQICLLQITDSGIQAAAHTQITFKVFALCVDQKNHPFKLDKLLHCLRKLEPEIIIARACAESNSGK